MIANAIVIICTVLMVGAVIWVLMGERNTSDHDEDNKGDKTQNEDLEDKK